MKVVIAADHGGFELKNEIKEWLGQQKDIEVLDGGPFHYDAVDSYADFVRPMVEAVRADGNTVGVFVCRTGNGPAMMANKFRGIRAAVCINTKYAQLARDHNNANVLCLGADMMTMADIHQTINTFLNTAFGGGRHIPRIGAFEGLGEK